MERPDSTSSDDELYAHLAHCLAGHGSVTELGQGVLVVDIAEDAPAVRRIQVRMTARQLRETVTSLSADGQEALGIADPVAAGWALFAIHLEEDLGTLRPGEGYLLWHEGALRPSADLEWPPRRVRESS